MALTQVQSGLLESGSALENIGAGNITPSYLSTQSQYTGFKNRIINGAMVIDQRNSANVAVTANGSYNVDRFLVNNSTDGAYSAQQDSSAPEGFTKSLKITTTTADATLTTTQQLLFNHYIEGYNVADLGWGTANAKTVTLSFWVRSSLTGAFGGALKNSSSDRSYLFTYTINSADTWEYKTVTVVGETTGTWDKTTGRGISLIFGLGVGPDRSGTAGVWSNSNLNSATGTVSVIGTLNATWYITGVQLEVGSTATSFDYRPYGTELVLCQRYYQTGNISCYKNSSGSTAIISTQYLVQTRATPTITVLSTSATIGVGWGSGDLITTTSVDFANGTSGEQRQRINFSVVSEL